MVPFRSAAPRLTACLLLVCSVVATSCSGGDGASSAGAAEPKLDPLIVRVAMLEEPSPDPATLNPVDEISVLVSDLLFDGLTRYKAETRTIEPSIAASWSTSDGITWSFVLDRKRTYSDGSPITANAVIESLTRVARLNDSSIGASRLSVLKGFAEFASGSAPTISGLRAADEWTVTVEAASVNYELPALMADPTYGIVGFVEGAMPTVADVGATSGPFTITDPTSVRAAKSIELVPVVDDDVTVSGVTFRRFGSAELAVKALKDQQVDIAPLPAGTDSPSGSTARLVSAATIELALNTRRAPWTDIANRRTLMGGLDRQSVAEQVTQDADDAMSAVVPFRVLPTVECGAECTASSDQIAALRVLGDATGSVHLDLLKGAESEAVADSLESQLDNVGFTVTQEASEPDELGATLSAGGLDLLVYGAVGLTPSPDPYLSESLATGASENLVGLSSPDFDAAVVGARSTVDPQVRAAAYEALNAKALESATLIPLIRVGAHYGVSDRLRRAEPAIGVLFDGRQIGIW